jgi:hypothetical protein
MSGGSRCGTFTEPDRNKDQVSIDGTRRVGLYCQTSDVAPKAFCQINATFIAKRWDEPACVGVDRPQILSCAKKNPPVITVRPIREAEIAIVAEENFTIKVGSASVTFKKSGDIVIKGGKIEVTASGEVVIKGSKTTDN